MGHTVSVVIEFVELFSLATSRKLVDICQRFTSLWMDCLPRKFIRSLLIEVFRYRTPHNQSSTNVLVLYLIIMRIQSYIRTCVHDVPLKVEPNSKARTWLSYTWLEKSMICFIHAINRVEHLKSVASQTSHNHLACTSLFLNLIKWTK